MVDKEWDPALEYVKHRVFSSIPTRPTDSPQARDWYIQEMPSFVNILKNCKTPEEIKEQSRLFRKLNGYTLQNYLGKKFVNISCGYEMSGYKTYRNLPQDFS